VASGFPESSVGAEMDLLGKGCVRAGVDDGVIGADATVNGSARRCRDEGSVNDLVMSRNSVEKLTLLHDSSSSAFRPVLPAMDRSFIRGYAG